MNLRRIVSFCLLLLLSVASTRAGTIVRFHTNFGDIDVELYDSDKPGTVANFLHYVQSGSYSNMFLHRVVQDFVVQGGGFVVVNKGTQQADHTNIVTFPPITNEISVGKFYSNVYGTIAMAKTSDPDSATSQFFFNLGDNSASLDNATNSGGFTVFGHVIAGTNILNVFKIGPTNTRVKQSDQGGAFNQLPILGSANLNSVTFDDLIFADVIETPTTPGVYDLFAPVKGVYNGLFTGTDGVGNAVEGSVALSTTALGKFTGSLRMGTARYSLKGALDPAGSATITASSGLQSPLSVYLHVDSTGDLITGVVSNAVWSAQLAADRAVFDIRTNPATAFAGKYTLLLPGSTDSNTPAGNGFAAITVDFAGKVKVTGNLADGSILNQTIPLSRSGRNPIYASYYAGKGSIAGWLYFTNPSITASVVNQPITGSLHWRKTLGASGKLFPAGFDTTLVASGNRYIAPDFTVRLLDVDTVTATFSGGNLIDTFTNSMTQALPNKFSKPAPNTMTLMLTLSSGLFKGTIKPPGSTRSIPFKGAVLQNESLGQGYFLGPTLSSSVVLDAP